MKKILFISYYFPPLGGGGVQRSLKFVKYLPIYKWIPIVITSKGLLINKIDNSLLNELSNNIKVYYLPVYSILNLKNKIKNLFLIKIIHLLYYLHIPDGLFFWFYFNKNKIKKIILDENIDIIYSTSPPATSHLFGLYCKKKFKNIKWIADFRDEWVTNPELKYQKNYIKNNFIKSLISKYIEKNIINKADKIIVVSQNTKKNFIKKYKLPEKIKIITNGYDEEDFKSIKKNQLNTYNKTFKLLYFGSLYGSRHAYNFLEAFKNFINKINNKNFIKIDFIGNIDKKNNLESYLLKNNLADYITLIDYIENKKLFTIIKNYSVLLLFVSNYHLDFIPGKLYEYMRFNIPILAMIPLQSNAGEIIKKSGTGFIVDFNDIESIEEHLSKLYSKWGKNILLKEYLKNKNWKFIEQFDRKILTKKLSNILNSLK